MAMLDEKHTANCRVGWGGTQVGGKRGWGMRTARSAIAVAVAATALGMITVSAGATDSTGARRRKCKPGYSPCFPNRRSDVDCYGGSGNGPRYTKPGVVYRVTGRDRYGLDADNDGKGCE
jgi:hypothetical protein